MATYVCNVANEETEYEGDDGAPQVLGDTEPLIPPELDYSHRRNDQPARPRNWPNPALNTGPPNGQTDADDEPLIPPDMDYSHRDR